jgi:hypothetical protein
MGGVKAAEPSRFVMLILLQPVPSCRPHLRRRLINCGIIVLVCVHLLVTKPYVVDIVGEMNSSISTRASSKHFCRSNISTQPYFPISLSSVRRRAVVAQSNTQEAVLTDFQRREAETAARFVQNGLMPVGGCQRTGWACFWIFTVAAFWVASCAGGMLTKLSVQRKYQRRHRACNGRQCKSDSASSG